MNRLAHLTLALAMLVLTAAGQSNIRQVDFKNFTYSANCMGETPSKVTVKDGEYSKETQQDGYVDRFYFTIREVSYGDLSDDRQDEAIIISNCNTGGTGQFTEGFVYTLRRGKPVLVGRIAGGDRAYGGLRTTRVEGGLLFVESNDAGTEGASCCPQSIITTKYKLGPRGLAKVSSASREIFPKQRVTFPKGSSGTTVVTRIPSAEGARLIVGARAGQTLTVAVNSDKASLRLLDGLDEVEFKVMNRTFVAKLPKSGDYSIELANDSPEAISVQVSIKIQ